MKHGSQKITFKMGQRKEKLSQVGIEIRDKQMMIKVMKHMFLCNDFNEMDLTAWKQNLKADKTFNNAVICFKEKYKEKMSFWKAMARQLGYLNQANEMPKVSEVLEQMAEASIEDRQLVNLVVEYKILIAQMVK